LKDLNQTVVFVIKPSEEKQNHTNSNTNANKKTQPKQLAQCRSLSTTRQTQSDIKPKSAQKRTTIRRQCKSSHVGAPNPNSENNIQNPKTKYNSYGVKG
jgi:hypothetical protein